MRLTLIGIVVGIAGALAVSRLMQQTLFEVNAADPLVYLALSVSCWSSRSAPPGFRPAARDEDRSALIALRSE